MTNYVAVVERDEFVVITVSEQGPPGPPGTGSNGGIGTPLWWILPDEVVEVPSRAQYTIHGEFRNEGELRLGANAELRVTA